MSAALFLFVVGTCACLSGRKPARSVVPSHWNQIEPARGNTPVARNYHAMVFDEHRSRIVLFGGITTSKTLFDLWEWDGSSRTWTDRTPAQLPAAWPPARLAHALTYDSRRRRVVLFGGVIYRQSVGQQLGDTWEWDGDSGVWTNATPTPGAATPSPRQSTALAYDEARGRAFLWGGFDSSGLNPIEAWEWDGQLGTWTDRTPSPLPAAWPAARDGDSLVYDTVGQRVILYGGFDGDYFGDLWAWDGVTASWTSLTPNPLPRSWPMGRHSMGVAIDPKLARMVVFGGFNRDTLGDLWEWDVEGGEWRNRTPSPLNDRWPSPRYGGVLTWDGTRERLMLFGGDGPSVEGNAMWEWDGS